MSTEGLLKWLKARVNGYDGVEVKNFTTSWKDGLAMCALVHSEAPHLIPFAELSSEEPIKNLNLAFEAAESLGIPALLDAEDLQIRVPEKLSIITYLGQFPSKFTKKPANLDESVQSLLKENNPTQATPSVPPSSQPPKQKTSAASPASASPAAASTPLQKLLDFEYIHPSRTHLLGRPDSLTCQDLSEASKLLQPYWTWVAAQLPPWLAPNLITIGGGAVVVLAYLWVLLAALWHDRHLPFSSISFLFMAVAIWVFQTADAVDGKQARRVGWSNVLGDLVDHITDQIALGLAVLSAAHCMGVWQPFVVLMVATCIFVQANMLHCEVSVTNVMVLPNGSSITEGQLITIALHLLCYLLPSLFSWNLLSTLTFGAVETDFGRVGTILALASLSVSVLGSVTSFNNVKKAVKANTPLEVAPYFRDMQHAAFVAFALLWLSVLDGDALASGAVLIAATWIATGTFVVLGGKLIVKRLCDEPLKQLEPCVAPAAAALLSSVLYRVVGLDIRWLVFVAAGVASLLICAHYYVCVMRQIARVKGIPVLSLPPDKVKAQ